VLASDGTGDGYSWVAYMESDNPYGVPNMDTICSNNAFSTHTSYRVTADSYAKGHQMLSVLALGGDNMYEVFHSSHGTTTDVDYNVYLIIYQYGWTTAPDNEGPVTNAVIANPNPAPSGGTFTLSATIDDTNTGFSGIQAAQYYIRPVNLPPGTPVWGSAMTVSGNNEIETATATVNTPGVDGDYFYAWVRGQDVHGNWGEGSYVLVDVTLGNGPTPAPYDISMPSGASAGDWVFVSFAYPMSGNIETVLDDSVNGGGGTTWDVAKWYNPQDASDHWKTYRVGSGQNDLATIDNTMGVWLHLTATDGTLTTSTVGAYSTSNVDIPLYAGWNLVSYPSATNRPGDATLPTQADFVASYSASAPYLITDDVAPSAVTFIEGNAYWVHVTADTTWSVAP